MRTREVNSTKLQALRGPRSREVIAHELRKRGWGSDAKAIWRYETGRNRPSSRLLPDYAAVLGASSVDELYTDEEAGDDDEEADQLRHLTIDELLRRRAHQVIDEALAERSEGLGTR